MVCHAEAPCWQRVLIQKADSPRKSASVRLCVRRMPTCTSTRHMPLCTNAAASHFCALRPQAVTLQSSSSRPLSQFRQSTQLRARLVSLSIGSPSPPHGTLTLCAISHSHTAPLNSAVLATVSLGSLSASMSESIFRSTSFLICGGPGRTLMSQGRTQCTLRPRATPHPGPSLGRSATCRGRDFPWPAPRRTAPSPPRPFPPGWRQPAWAHGGDERPEHTEGGPAQKLTHLPSMRSISSQPATESQGCRRWARAPTS